jgi:hypothetical protein
MLQLKSRGKRQFRADDRSKMQLQRVTPQDLKKDQSDRFKPMRVRKNGPRKLMT